jgi:hypothetical protein
MDMSRGKMWISRQIRFFENNGLGKYLTTVANCTPHLKIADARGDLHNHLKSQEFFSPILQHYAQTLLCPGAHVDKTKLSTKLSTVSVENRPLHLV